MLVFNYYILGCSIKVTNQFAKAAGATVIATTSSREKAETLKKLGADHVISYKTTPNWGEEAVKLIPGGLGVNQVIEVGGPTTMAQSLKAIKVDGHISIIGYIGGSSKNQPTFLDCLNSVCIVRGIIVGNRQQLEDLIHAIDANGIKPVVDDKVFKFEETKEAYQYMVSSGCGRSRDDFTDARCSGIRSILGSIRLALTRGVE